MKLHGAKPPVWSSVRAKAAWKAAAKQVKSTLGLPTAASVKKVNRKARARELKAKERLTKSKTQELKLKKEATELKTKAEEKKAQKKAQEKVNKAEKGETKAVT